MRLRHSGPVRRHRGRFPGTQVIVLDDILIREAEGPGSAAAHARVYALTLALALAGVIPTPALGGEAPRLSLPVSCDAARPCLVQSYVDLDPGTGVRDFACGSATYDGHKGTDFRLLSASEVRLGVPVRAAADGTVKGMRDGMADAFVTPATRAALAGRECGNGVVIDHGGGWETQYCHLRRGSVRVRPGEAVSRGQALGEIGFSGLTEFAHLHLEVRKDGETVDPFTGRGMDAACEADPARRERGLWDETAAAALGYANGEIVSATFSEAMPAVAAFERDHRLPAPTPASAQLVFVARLLNLRAGDVIELAVTGPGGFAVEHRSEPLPRTQATYVSYAGKRRTGPAWAQGDYTGRARLVRAGAAVSELTGTLTLK